MLLQIAEIALRLPVSNAWPECLARMEVTTRCRNSLQNEMLEALLMVLINGLSVKDCGLVVKLAVKMWLAEKKRKKEQKYLFSWTIARLFSKNTVNQILQSLRQLSLS